MSSFWKELFKFSGTTLKFSTAYHPQTDRQTDILNRSLEQYLRAFTFDHPKRWAFLLPWAELALDCNFNMSIRMSLFKALYGRDSPSLCPTISTKASVHAVEELLVERPTLLRDLKPQLTKMQQRMNAHANQHRQDVAFEVGDQVLLKIQPYRQFSVARPCSAKLVRRFYGPFTVLERIGSVAYRLSCRKDARYIMC